MQVARIELMEVPMSGFEAHAHLRSSDIYVHKREGGEILKFVRRGCFRFDPTALQGGMGHWDEGSFRGQPCWTG